MEHKKYDRHTKWRGVFDWLRARVGIVQGIKNSMKTKITTLLMLVCVAVMGQTKNYVEVHNGTSTNMLLKMNGNEMAFPPNSVVRVGDFDTNAAVIQRQTFVGYASQGFLGAVGGFPDKSVLVSYYDDGSQYVYSEKQLDNMDEKADIWPSVKIGMGIGFLYFGFGWILGMAKRVPVEA